LRCWLLLVALVFAFSAGGACAHEVRPAYLEITERRDGHADLIWRQPSQGALAVALRPAISGGLTDRAPDRLQQSHNVVTAQWRSVDLHEHGLDGREVRIEGLDCTITDALVIVHLASGDTIQQILTPASPNFTIDARAGAAVWAYLRLGIEHILTGVDHLLFVFGLILLSANFRSLLKTITAFTVAHSITLALTALKLLSLKPELVEAMVAFSILFLAVELVRQRRGEIGLTLRHPWIIAFGFGLLHGAAFAGALKEIGLPEGNIPAALFLFNVGVEIGQLLFVSLVCGLLWALRRVALPEWTPAVARTVAIYGIGSFSMFWFLERLQLAVTSVV
jgi:hydrogenase/urease accessory protein HupE